MLIALNGKCNRLHFYKNWPPRQQTLAQITVHSGKSSDAGSTRSSPSLQRSRAAADTLLPYIGTYRDFSDDGSHDIRFLQRRARCHVGHVDVDLSRGKGAEFSLLGKSLPPLR
jgi:hypothetical protein